MDRRFFSGWRWIYKHENLIRFRLLLYKEIFIKHWGLKQWRWKLQFFQDGMMYLKIMLVLKQHLL